MMQPMVFGLFCVNICTIINKVVIIIATFINVSSLMLKTKDISLNLEEATEIVLNCTFNKTNNEDIGDRNIRWQKQIDGTFEDLGIFSHPGGREPFIEGKMEASYRNRTQLIAPTNASFSAVLIIKDIVCDDAGLYQCRVDYFIGNEKHEKTNRTTVAFKVAASSPTNFCVFPIELEENQSLTLSCIADVGSPKGNIKIWKLEKDFNVPMLIFTSNASDYVNCTEIINATFTYTASRDDNGALFRCSSQNALESEAEQSLKSKRISVSYGPYETIIWLTPTYKSSFYVGDDVQIHCKTDSYPRSNFTWSFLSGNYSKEMEKSISLDNSELMLKNIQLNNSGDYMCTVNNGIGTDSKVVSITVREPLKKNRTRFNCDQCGYSEICLKEHGEVYCVTNVWMPIAIIFIIPCPILVGIMIYLIKQRKSSQNQQSQNNSLQPQSVEHPSHPSTSRDYSLAFSGQPFDSPNHPSEAETLLSEPASGSQTVCRFPYDHDAGYSTHQDIMEMQEQCTMLPQPDERDDPTASQEDVMLPQPDEHDDTLANQEKVMLPNPDERDESTAGQEKVQYAGVSKKQPTENVYTSFVSFSSDKNVLYSSYIRKMISN